MGGNTPVSWFRGGAMAGGSGGCWYGIPVGQKMNRKHEEDWELTASRLKMIAVSGNGSESEVDDDSDLERERVGEDES